MDIKKLNRELGNTDLMLIDQILKNRFTLDMSILDAGCGEGRNLTFFVRNNYRVYGIDKDKTAIKMARLLCRSMNRDFVTENIQPFRIEENPFPDNFFDAVICINVLHGVTNRDEFFQLWDGLFRVTRKGGLLFVSMESRWAREGTRTNIVQGEKWISEDHGKFYLTRNLISEILSQGGCREIEPVKTLLNDQRASQTYLLLKKQT